MLSWRTPVTRPPFNTLRPKQNGRHFPDDIFKSIFLNENVWISIKISLKFVPGGPNNNFPALFQIMAWRRPGDKPLFEPMMVSLPTHICVTRPQWVKHSEYCLFDAGYLVTSKTQGENHIWYKMFISEYSCICRMWRIFSLTKHTDYPKQHTP